LKACWAKVMSCNSAADTATGAKKIKIRIRYTNFFITAVNRYMIATFLVLFKPFYEVAEKSLITATTSDY